MTAAKLSVSEMQTARGILVGRTELTRKCVEKWRNSK